jgi:ABC-2 type transport system ATP-binding protein
MDTAIRCSQLVKTYPGSPPVEAVRGLDLEVPRGECFGLLGPNGAGKTTTIEILEGLLQQTSGDVEVLGRRWGGRDEEEIRQRIGISLQETRLSEKLTVRETVKLFRSFYRAGISAAEAITRVSMEEKADARVGKLSGGQKQRLAVACALVGDPELVFLDEPTTGLDPQSRRQLWQIIRDFRDRGRTVLLTTHYMDEAEKLCDRVAIVDHGKVIALGSPAELIARLGGDHVIELAFAEDQPVSSTGIQIRDQFTEQPQPGPVPARPRPGLPPAAFTELPGVLSAREEDGVVELRVSQLHAVLPAVLDRVGQGGTPLARLTTRQASLEDVFVQLTGRHLRDEGGA